MNQSKVQLKIWLTHDFFSWFFLIFWKFQDFPFVFPEILIKTYPTSSLLPFSFREEDRFKKFCKTNQQIGEYDSQILKQHHGFNTCH